MLKSFRILLQTVVPVSFVCSSSLFSANFSVDTNDASGPGSLNDVIKSSNALAPEFYGYNSFIFRSNLSLNKTYPELRNNADFNIQSGYTIKMLSPLRSTATFMKSGSGVLEINAPFDFIGDWQIKEGVFIKNHPSKCQGKYVVTGEMKIPNIAYLGINDIVLKNGGKLSLNSNAALENLIVIETSGQIDVASGNLELKNIKGAGQLIKIGQGHLELNAASGFQGSLSLIQGSFSLKNLSFQGPCLLNGGILNINSPKDLEHCDLTLQKGQMTIKTPTAKFTKSVNAKGADVAVNLNSSSVNLDKGLSGWGIIEFNGPGLLNMNGQSQFSGHIKLNNLNFVATEFSKNTLYKLQNSVLNLAAISEVDFTTRFEFLPGTNYLIYNNNPVILNASLEGKGDVIVAGADKITVRSLAPFKGNWAQKDGHLHLEGALNKVIVSENASLSGHGIINTLHAKGKFAPQINASNTQNVLTASEAVLDGIVLIRPEQGTYKPGSYEILNSSSSKLGDVHTMAPAQFEGFVAKEGEKLKYVLQKFYLLSDYINKNSLDNLAVANSFDNYFAEPFSDRDNIIRNLLSLKNDPVKFQAAFNGLQPAYFSALGLTQEYNFILARSSLSNRMEELLLFPCARQYIWDEPLAVWLDPVGDFTQQDPRQDDMGFNAATVGGFFGFDGKIGSSLRLGLSTGYTNSRVKWMEDCGKGIINSAYLAGYFLFRPNRFYLNGSLSGSYSHYNAQRNINIVTIQREARHKNHGFGFEADLELGYIFKGKTQLQPYVRQSYIGLYQQKFQESGAGSLDLNVDSKKFAMYRIDAGFIFSRCLDYKRFAITPEVSLSGIWEQELKTGTFFATYQDTGLGYEVVGMKPKRLLISPGAAIDFVIKKYPMMIGARYHGEFSSQFIDQRISGHIGYGF